MKPPPMMATTLPGSRRAEFDAHQAPIVVAISQVVSIGSSALKGSRRARAPVAITTCVPSTTRAVVEMHG